MASFLYRNRSTDGGASRRKILSKSSRSFIPVIISLVEEPIEFIKLFMKN